MDDPFMQSREWRTVRMRALERDGAKCACCGATAANGAVMNVDHIKPRGRHPELALTVENLQVLCNACNHGKGNVYETDWRRGQAPHRPAAPAPRLIIVPTERCLLSMILAGPASAMAEGYDAFVDADQTADERALAWALRTIRARPNDQPSTAELVALGAEEFGDILAGALLIWEGEAHGARA